MPRGEKPVAAMTLAQENQLAIVELRLGLASLRQAVHRLSVRQECDALHASDELERADDRITLVDSAYQDLALAVAALDERVAWAEQAAPKRRRK